ncbi:esterase family protein [Paenarthrobacter sp. PAE-2]|uniref:alpha/beta hydrolase n=1 Tax=Paenarthrobacter sp. PAE-2 TaxID=2982532 RepID=UPI0022300A3D|nr:esterase family protein [Paenarthrobacter sp. PAE-2]MCW3767300.1 esterase family protein [Paenarthrobacter sp. PAE-2]
MDFIADISLVQGPVLWCAWTAGAAGGLYLLWGRGVRWALRAVIAVLLAAAVVAAVHWFLVYVFYIFPGTLPWEIMAWSVAGVGALLLWLVRLRGPRWRGKAAATAALLGVLLLSAVQINAYFGLNRTVGDLLGTAVARIQPLETGLMRQPGGPAPTNLDNWTSPGNLPSVGLLRKAAIPGPRSGLNMREAFIYLPPAYRGTQRPALPVLVLFSGQPGGPADWLTGGALRSQLDRFAAAHNGLAPVVVVVDPNGSANGNTMCMDSRIAQADTFLSQDVPAWISQTLDVDNDPRQWAVGGFSFGATCAVQMGTRHPDLYPSVLAFASEQEPALAKERQKTIDVSFGGDTASFEAQTPLQLMKQGNFAGKTAYFAAGAKDPEFLGYMEVLSAAAGEAGFMIETREIANTGHSWDMASRALPGALDFMAVRWGISQ